MPAFADLASAGNVVSLVWQNEPHPQLTTEDGLYGLSMRFRAD